ncbi:toxin YdaT family protein [Chromobacterium subtsugae]|uniref:toxin YdaT family protein n=1 Tax=Chromobacterium subtsugae TaxID=251747 RepID=UPI000AB82132|nr:toxin YdaT family protein [Chromobacterium subtsugae]
MRVMNVDSHKSILRLLRDALEEWEHRDKATREVVADRIVSSYYASSATRQPRFEFKGYAGDETDMSRAMTTNAQRIWRWLDDQSKTANLLPSSFLPVILGALPMDLRLSCMTEWLRPLGLDVALVKTVDGDATHAALVAAAAKEAGEAVSAFSLLADGMSQPALMRAKVELEEGSAAFADAINHVSRLLERGK